MDMKLWIVLAMHCLSLVFCKKDCEWTSKHTFEVETGASLSFRADIKELRGFVIDINYEEREHRENCRINLSPTGSVRYKHNGTEYIKTELGSIVAEGLQDFDIFVGNNTINVTCITSQKAPLEFITYPGVKSITVSSANLKICEESCNTEKSVDKNIEKEEIFKMTAFTTSNYPITFKIRSSDEKKPTSYVIIKPRGCKHDSKSVPCSNIHQGWNILEIFANRTSLTINNNIIPVDIGLRTLGISGEYLINCTKGTPKWKISKEEIPIPIYPGQELFFTLTSTVDFSPVFKLDGNEWTLYWNNGMYIKYGSSGTQMKPNEYHIIFEITSKNITLYNEDKRDILMVRKLETPPEELFIRSTKGEFQLALSMKYLSTQPIETIPDQETVPVTRRTQEKASSPPVSPAVITFSIIIPLFTIGIIIMIFIIRKRTKGKLKDDIGPNDKQIMHNRDEDVEYSLLNSNDGNECGNIEQRIKDDIGPNIKQLKRNRDEDVESPLLHSNDGKDCGKIEQRIKVDLGKILQNSSQLIEVKNKLMKIYKIKMNTDDHDLEKKIEKVSIGKLDPSVPTKSILLLGETGSGKSSTINTLVNFMYGIKLEDQIRLIVVEEKSERKPTESQSQTEFITSYIFPYQEGMPNNCNYILIDTPGFGDTRGVEHDQQSMIQLKNFITQDYGISHIDIFAFVVKATIPRLTLAQEYLYDGIFSMFGNDINHNIFLLVTFAAADDPPVLKVLEAADMKYHSYFKLNTNSLYLTYSQNSESGDLNFTHHRRMKNNWERTENSLQCFFEKISTINPVSLSLTKVVLEDNSRLYSIVDDLQKQINEGVDKLAQLKEKQTESAKPEEAKLIEKDITHTEERLINYIQEAQKLTVRLKEIPLRLDPLSIHGYIEKLIMNEEKEKSTNYARRIQVLEKLKEKNSVLKAVINKERITDGESWLNYFQKMKKE